MTPQELELLVNQKIAERLANGAKDPVYRINGQERKKFAGISLTKSEREIITRFGRGSISAGVQRAARFIEKYNLYEREDC